MRRISSGAPVLKRQSMRLRCTSAAMLALLGGVGLAQLASCSRPVDDRVAPVAAASSAEPTPGAPGTTTQPVGSSSQAAASLPASGPGADGAGVVEANEQSAAPRISADGTAVVFESLASNLVDGDANNASDVFRVLLATGALECASLNAGGVPGNAMSWAASVSGDGRRVAFTSDATDLVPPDGNAASDVFVRSWAQHSLYRASVGPGAVEANAFSRWPDFADDGRWLVFVSFATNLIPADTNAVADVFLYEARSAEVTRVSLPSTGEQRATASGEGRVSGDGSVVVFSSAASDMTPDDTNRQPDIFVNFRKQGRTRRVSVSSAGAQANGHSSAPAISADGRVVAFESWASNLVPDDTNDAPDVFVHELATGRTTRVSVRTDGGQAAGHSRMPALSADGRIVAFHSFAENLVECDDNYMSDVFVHERETGTTSRVSVSSAGDQANKDSEMADITADGRLVVFQSVADNLVMRDTNRKQDIFLHDRKTGATRRISVRPR